jgi:nitroreductase
MPASPAAATILDLLTGLRQFRQFTADPVPDEVIAQLLEVARWTGSSKNTQPWEFIVVTEAKSRKALAEAGAFTQFLAEAPAMIVIVLDGASPRSEAYDEGRVSERIMLAASALGLGSGTGWFSTPDAKEAVRKVLGIPEEKDVWQAVAFGTVDTARVTRPGVQGGRKPLSELVSYERYGERR